MDATTKRLVDFALSSRFDVISEAVLHECKRHLVDTFACVADGYADPVCAMARAAAGEYSGSPLATVWGSGAQTTPDASAFANGIMLRFTDLSDTYVGKSRGHPSDMIPAIIAAAEVSRLGGGDVMRAMVVAYDVYCSFIDAIDINTRGWDQPVYGVLGIALGVGRMLGFTREQLGHAVALALTPNMALAQARLGELSNWKACAGANAARNGLFAVMLAQRGMTGPPAVFEGKGGLWEAIGAFDWPLPAADGPYLVTQSHLKSLPLCYHGQSTVLAAILLRAKVKLDDIAAIDVETYGTAVMMMASEPSRWAPATRETADHSIPYVVAIALLDGEVTRDSFDDDRLRDPAVAALMRKVTVKRVDALDAQYPEGAPSRVTVRLNDGRTIVEEVRYPSGHARNPMNDAEVVAKFRASFDHTFAAQDVDHALQGLWSFDAATDVRRDLLRRFDFIGTRARQDRK